MDIKVLIYDNELGYYQLVKSSIQGVCDFTLYTHGLSSKGYDVIVFFMHQEMEALDMVKLYRDDVPFILGINKGEGYITQKDNTFIINTGYTRDDIIDSVAEIFNRLLPQLKQQKAL